MLSAAYSLVRYGFDVDELINHAWLDSIRRMDLDSSMSYIYRIATRSMNQYIVGGHKRRTRNIAELEFKLRIRTIDGFDFVRNDYCYSYDDVDEILVVLRKLPIRTQEIIVLRLQGMYFKDIGKKYCMKDYME